MYDLSDGEVQPKSLPQKLDQLPNFSKWAKAVVAEDSVTYIWNKENMASMMKRRIPQLRQKLGN
jgi:glutathione S-transferase